MTDIDSDKITGSQFVFTVACFIQASGLLSAYLLGVTETESIFAVLGGIIVALPMLFTIIFIMKRFPHKNLIEINDIVFGKKIGKVISALYILFFVTVSALNFRDASTFIQKTIMHATPIAAIVLIFIIVCGFSVYYGIEVSTRYNAMFSIVAIFVAIFAFILIYNKMDFNNFLPFFQLKPIKYIQGANIFAAIPLGEMIALLMITPNIKKNKNSIGKLFFIGAFIGISYILLVMTTDIAVLGSTIKIFSLPTFETLRLISVGEAISRMEILFAVVFIVLMFSKMTFLYYIVLLAIAQLFKLKHYKHLILSIGAILCIYSLTAFDSNIAFTLSSTDTIPIIWLFFEYILPLLTVCFILARKLGDKKGDESDSASDEQNSAQEDSKDKNPIKEEKDLAEKLTLENSEGKG